MVRPTYIAYAGSPGPQVHRVRSTYDCSVPTLPTDPLARPVERPLSLPQLERVLDEASRRAGGTRSDGYEVLEIWGSRTAAIYRCRGRGTNEEVVVKVGHGWSAADAERLEERFRTLRSTLDPTLVRVPEPLGWAGDPPSVCTRYVDGTDLYFMLLDPNHPSWEADGMVPHAVLERCGAALAHIHATSEEPTRDERRRAFDRARSVAARLRLRPVGTERLRPVTGFGDVGPHQFRIGEGGEVWVLDPPADAEPALPHEDVATFVSGIDKLVRAASGGRGRRATLREAFLDGYARAGDIDPRRADDRWFLRMFETRLSVGTARRRLRDRELLEAGRQLARSVAGQVWLRTHHPG